MSEYFNRLQQRLNKYEDVYRYQESKAAFKLIWWNIRWILSRKSQNHFHSKQTGNAPLKIAVKLNGGIGDILLQGTYLKELVRYFDGQNILIDFYAFFNEEMGKSIFYHANFAHTIRPLKALNGNERSYDLVLDITRFVMIAHIDWDRVKKNSEKLYNYCKKIQIFSEENSFMLNNSPQADHLSIKYSLLNGKNRASQADILGILNLNETTPHFLDINPQYIESLAKLSLKNKRYITLQRGINHNNKNNESVRNWPIEHYENFIQLIKKHYPDITTVQLGYSTERNSKFDGVDIDLRGKTNLEELKVILKYGFMHIDSESGYIHLNHFLNGKSIALFGPTTIQFYGYATNINIGNQICPEACEWVTKTWLQKCCRGFDTPPCMQGITPEEVFEKFTEYESGYKNYSYSLEGTYNLQEVENSLLDKISKKVAVINMEKEQILSDSLMPSPDSSTVYLGLNKGRLSSIEFSGTYNVSSKDNSFDLIIAKIDDDALYPGYILLDILRVLKPNGRLFLSCKSYRSEELVPIILDLPSNELGDFFVIQKSEGAGA